MSEHGPLIDAALIVASVGWLLLAALAAGTDLAAVACRAVRVYRTYRHASPLLALRVAWGVRRAWWLT